ncbi:MAG: TonB-dependent receptor [Balneolales bacterium]
MLLGSARNSYSQSITQSIKGNVYDSETQSPLVGATVLILDTDPLLGTSTDLEGNFVVQNAKLGRYTIQINYIGYEPAFFSEVLITSGKEVVLNAGLRQSVSEMEGLTFVAGIRKEVPLNSMATNSARAFTVEETRRYAGGLDDPARLVSAFAGVTTGNIQDNAIIVRGNSPKGISWRLEGVEIPAPHHFPNGNVAGGGVVTLFSSQMLANSDFFTSAFPAEYGNATAGVFDMNFRNGNYGKREHTVQTGLLGIDVASEGPIVEGSNASYIFNYRYSTFGLMTDLNLIPSDQLLKYQDLSFKFNVPTKHAGTFSLWGIGGMDNATEPEQRDSTAWYTDWDRVSFGWDVQTGAAGLSHRFIAGSQTFINTTIAATGVRNKMETFRLDDELTTRPEMLADDNSGKLSIGSYVNHKFSPRFSTKTGINYKVLFHNMEMNSTDDHQPDTYHNVVNNAGNSSALESYTQTRYILSQGVRLNAGINVGYFGLNNALNVDPRLGLSWAVTPAHRLSLGYGKHTQMEELKIYLVKEESGGSTTYPNKDLKLSVARHLVLGYDWNMTDNHRLKVETYYQHIDKAPGIADSSYSLINYKQEWAFGNTLENNSMGRNMGVDVTFERFLNNDYYYLITGSVFESKYKADDGVWRNTRFNKGFVANALLGKEYFFRDDNHVLGLNGRMTYVGGERMSPILLEETMQEKREIFDESRAFGDQLPSSFTADFTVTYRLNRRNHSSVWALQVKNIFGAPMHFGRYYNIQDKEVQMDKSVVIVPNLSYKIEF